MSLNFVTHNLHIVLIAGEISGDEIGARIISGVRKQLPSARFSGAVGPSMKKEGCAEWVSIDSFQVMGLCSVLENLPRILRAKRRLVQKIEEERPDCVLFIDQPSFSIHVAQKLRSFLRHPPLLLQVVAPSVWAYRPRRAEKLQGLFDALFVLYRFEVPYFSHHLPTYWIGHPGMSSWMGTGRADDARKKPVVALYPGSRPSEIIHNLPIQLDAAKILLDQSHISSCAIQLSGSAHPYIEQEVEKRALQSRVACIPFTSRRKLMEEAQYAIAKSGTVTLELALSNTPTVVMYKTDLVTRLWAKFFLKISPHQRFSLPNILLGRDLFPEYIATIPTAEAIADGPWKQISHKDRATLLQELFPMRGSRLPEDIAADYIIELLGQTR